jgi:hypothetical protein
MAGAGGEPERPIASPTRTPEPVLERRGGLDKDKALHPSDFLSMLALVPAADCHHRDIHTGADGGTGLKIPF